MKFLVVGCNGMAGHTVSLYLKEQGHDVIGYARQKSRFVNTVVGDATDFALLKQTIMEEDYDSIVNCVGILNQFAEKNRANAVLINGYLPHFLAEITEKIETQIIHMSTDCVFSGKLGGDTEESVPDGVLFYDRTKAIGELSDEKNVTLRSSIIGPDIKEEGIGLLNWFMKQKEKVYGYTGAIWTGQTTLQLAKTIEQAAKQHAHGLINIVPKESISKYELLNLINMYIRKNSIEIVPMDAYLSDKSLVRTRFKDFNYEIPGYKEMIIELGDWMRAHRELYPHYDI